MDFNLNNKHTESLLVIFLGNKNQEKYLNYFRALSFYRLKVSWHWPAFFFTAFWLMYRRMWFGAVLYLITPFVFGFIALAARGSSGEVVASIITALGTAIYYISPPLIANYLYYLKFENEASKAQELFPENKENQINYLRDTGGTTSLLTMVFVAVPLYFGLNLLMIFILKNMIRV